MSHSVSDMSHSGIVMYFGPSSQKSISQQIFLVIMHIYFFLFLESRWSYLKSQSVFIDRLGGSSALTG